MTAAHASQPESRAVLRDKLMAALVRLVGRMAPVTIPESVIVKHARHAIAELKGEGYTLVANDELAKLHRLASLALNVEPGKRSPFEQSVIHVMDRIGALTW